MHPLGARGEAAAEPFADRVPQSVQRMQQIPVDQKDGPNGICAPFTPPGPFQIGTVCSPIMDPPRCELQIAPGNPRGCAYPLLSLS